jgi:hypothetical protein
MAHARDSIRLAVKALLADIPGLEDHVCFDEPRITEEDRAPWCYVWLGDEDIENVTIGQRPKKRRLVQLSTDLIGRDRFEVEQQCETIGAQVENRVDSSPTLSGLVKSIMHRSIAIERSSEAPILRYRMTFIVNYWTEAGTATATV